MKKSDKIHAGRMVAIAIAILLTGCSVFFFWQSYKEEKAAEIRNEQMEEELRPLYQERARVRQELDDTNHRGEEMGSLIFLFTDLNEIIYTDIYPQMEAYGYAGVLALSPAQVPGKEGCLSRQQFDELLEKGWKCCLRWEETEDAEAWLESNRKLIGEIGIDRPETVYFPSGAYSSEADAFLGRSGFSAAVHHGEENLSLIADEAEEGIWHPGAMPWCQSRADEMLSEASIRKGNLVFTIGSDSKDEMYDENKYGAMLDIVDRYCESGGLFVTDFSSAREYQEERYSGNEEQKAETENRIEELEMRMKELDDQINIIVDKYAR